MNNWKTVHTINSQKSILPVMSHPHSITHCTYFLPLYRTQSIWFRNSTLECFFLKYLINSSILYSKSFKTTEVNSHLTRMNFFQSNTTEQRSQNSKTGLHFRVGF
uniref:Uncharacterized protein n=1 Tax=Cacopsylla melanoneura TaxID=428564 RepID=A0A8D8TY59_9HEMI